MTSTRTSTATKKVTFSDLTIKEYPIILGDNPACTGCPITIDWEPMETRTRTISLATYECERTEQRRGQRPERNSSLVHLVIPVQKRSQILLDAGYTHKEIISMALEVGKIQKQRHESIKTKPTLPSRGLSMRTFSKFRDSFSKRPIIARSA